MATAGSGTRAWMFGPGTDLLLGCGVGYALLAGGLALLPVATNDLLRWGVLATFLTGMPHYGATLLRVYEDPADRRKYAFFSIWASLAVWLAFAAGVYAIPLGSLLVTIYVTWSPWHYAGQNYGLAVMFLRRRGVGMPPALKRPLYASFLLSFALTFLTLHGGYEASGYVPVNTERATYSVLSLGIPGAIYRPLFLATLVAHLGALAVAGHQILRRTSLRAALPAILLVATQAAWFTIPAVALWASGVRIQGQYVVFFFLWAGIAHAIQYLWVTTYYAVGDAPWSGRAAYLGKTLLAGAFAFGIPALLFAPGLLGRMPYETGLWLLIGAAVNLQHFILDGAIWKLRDGPVARILLASPGAADRHAPAQRSPWVGRAVWTAGALVACVVLGAAWEYEMGWVAAKERGDDARAALAERRLAAIGRDNPLFYERRAERLVADGDLAGAAAEYERSLELYPTYGAWYALGMVRIRGGDAAGAMRAFDQSNAVEPNAEAWTGIAAVRKMQGQGAETLDALDRALDLDPDYGPALHLAGRYWLERGDGARARELLTRAASAGPVNPQLEADLRRVGAAPPAR
jgi:hypothetical protein